MRFDDVRIGQEVRVIRQFDADPDSDRLLRMRKSVHEGKVVEVRATHFTIGNPSGDRLQFSRDGWMRPNQPEQSLTLELLEEAPLEQGWYIVKDVSYRPNDQWRARYWSGTEWRYGEDASVCATPVEVGDRLVRVADR